MHGSTFPSEACSEPTEESGGLPFRLHTPQAQSTSGAQALGPVFPTLLFPLDPCPRPALSCLHGHRHTRVQPLW